MAAVIELHTGRALVDAPSSRPLHRPPAPRLRVIHGGRSLEAQRLRRVFLLRRLAVLVGTVAVVWVLAQLVGAAMASPDADASPVSVPGAVHVVEPGDTLWALASAVEPQADPRDVVDRIIELNRDGTAVSPAGHLVAGEALRLPVGS